MYTLLELKLDGFSQKAREIVMNSPLVKLVEESQKNKIFSQKATLENNYGFVSPGLCPSPATL